MAKAKAKNKELSTLDKKNLDKKCKEIADRKDKKSKLERQAKDIGHELETLYDEVKPLIEKTDQKNWRVKGIGLFSPSFKEMISITDQERLKRILTKAKLTSLIRIHPNVVTDWAKGELNKMKEADGRKPKDKRKDFDIDGAALAEAASSRYGFSFYEKSAVSFSQREGKYVKEKSKKED